MKDGWERFWDENHQAYYLFNRTTGVSKWDDTVSAEGLKSQWEGFDKVVTTTEGTSKRKKKQSQKRCCSKAWSSVWQEMGIQIRKMVKKMKM